MEPRPIYNNGDIGFFERNSENKTGSYFRIEESLKLSEVNPTLDIDNIDKYVHDTETRILDLSFKTCYQGLKILSDDTLSNEEKGMMFFMLFELPYDIDVSKIVEFLYEPKWQGPNSSGMKTFDWIEDFDLLYSVILKDYNINLLRDELTWYEFKFIFEEITMVENALTTRIGYRGKLPASNDIGKEQYRFRQNMRDKYMLIQHSQSNVEDGLKSMIEYAKRKAGVKNG